MQQRAQPRKIPRRPGAAQAAAGSRELEAVDDRTGFSGAWSTYPFFRSGTVIVTSVQEGLFLLKPRPRAPVF
jgi:hypothetical protein